MPAGKVKTLHGEKRRVEPPISFAYNGDTRMKNADDEILEGTVEKIVYFNEENGYTVASLLPDDRALNVTIVGYLPDLRVGEHIRAHGGWHENPKFGRQFRVARSSAVPPTSVAGIERYLASGLIKGIGPVIAERIVKRFGEDTLRVINEEPARLREIEGIGRKTLDRIVTGWGEHKDLRETMIFLQAQGISTAYAARIIKQYGGGAARVVRDEPYRLACDITGIGFKLADSIARKMGIPHDSSQRAAAAALHVLTEMAGEGHVYCPMQSLIERCRQMLEVDTAIVRDGIATLGLEGRIVVEGEGETGAVYLAALHVAETGAARLLADVRGSLKLLPPLDAERAVRWFEQRHDITLNARQRDVIRLAVDSKTLVITGGPGTGKTTVIRALVEIFGKKDQRVVLAAPTGRAAKRMEEVAGIPAATIHRLLEFSPARMTFTRDRNNPIEVDVLIIDETSMLDIVLLYHLLKATPPEASIVFVGDADQLPSVGPGTVLRELIDSGFVDVVTLTEIFRQAAGSLIVSNAHRINRGDEPLLPHGEAAQKSDFHFVERADPADVAATIETLVTDRIPKAFGVDPLLDIQVLSPMHKGVAGVADLNARLQRALNPDGRELSHGARAFKPGDKVMQVKNNYDKDVFNGDVGFISSINFDAQQLTIDFDDRLILYEYPELEELDLAYAISVHKSQGSEYRAVVVPVIMQHYVLLQRNLMYTAVTRGKELVVLVGTREALSVAVRNATIQRRNSRLCARLKA
jgi:exodeoxyribonuclease V alpha subunit